MTALEVLIAARKLIEKPENWTQHEMRRDAAGTPVPSGDQSAVCWCWIGAIRHVETSREDGNLALDVCRRTLGIEYLTTFNDTHTHAEVLAAFDRAIELAGGAQ